MRSLLAIAAGVLVGSIAWAAPAPLLNLDDRAAAAALFDGIMERELARGFSPGAAVALVKDGRVVLLRGYGLADLASGRRVDPEATVFRVGSVSKPFTALAALILAGEGRLDLEADAGRFLGGWRLPTRFPGPVTGMQLLTHTSGFDVRLNGSARRRAEDVPALADYLASDMPPQVRPPGSVLVYSNHNYTVVGRMIEVAAGRDFPDAMRRLVLDPLGMSSSDFRFTPELARRAATGYEPRPGGPSPATVIHPAIVPAASVNTTARDMVRFMTALLDGGRLDGVQAIPEEAVRSMLTRRFTMDPGMAGTTAGLFESVEGGREVGHSGGIRGFMSGMFLWPDRGVGLFVADNGYDDGLIWDAFFEFVRRTVPYPSPTAGLAAPSPRSRFTGCYRPAAQPVSNLEKAGALRNGDLRVRAGKDGRLSMFGKPFVEIAPLTFKAADDDERVTFVTDAGGRVDGMLTTDPFAENEVWDKVPWWDRSDTQNLAFWVMLLSMVAAVIFRPKGAEPVVSLAHAERPADPLAHAAAWLATLHGGLQLGALAVAVLSMRAVRDVGLLCGVPAGMKAALAVPVAALPLAGGMVAFAVSSWRRGWWRPVWRVYYSSLAACAAVWPLFLFHWNLLGWRF